MYLEEFWIRNTINDVEFTDTGSLLVGTDIGSISLFASDSIPLKHLYPVQQFFKSDFNNLPVASSINYYNTQLCS